MKKLFVFLAVVLCFAFASAQSPCPPTATIDGVDYTVVQVGSQCWTASNMRNTHYSDGAEVMPVPLIFVSSMATDFDVTRYGYLYTPAAATRTWTVVDNEIQGICPEGWRIPTQDDMSALLAQVSVEQLMAGEDWLPQGGSNTVGFNLLPAGICNGTYNSFENYRVTTMLLTAEPSGTMVYHPCKFGDMCGSWEFVPGRNNDGYSVRCLRDAETLPVITDTIAFLPNGGQGTMDTMFVTRGDTALNANTYTHDGNWEFLGWNTEADGSGTHYDNYATITTNGNVTLYAQWGTWCTGTPQANESGTSRIDSVKDVNNNQYAVVQIGSQCWMKQNLRTITNTADTGNIYTPTTLGYDVETYGLLYDCAAVMQGESSTNYPDSGNVVQGICPTGWHVPSNAEWNTLTSYVNNEANGYRCGEDGTIAKALAATTGWNTANNTCTVGNNPENNNATGFSALPAGYINSSVTVLPYPHSNSGIAVVFSSATSNDAALTIRGLHNSSKTVSAATNFNKSHGISVRCVRNAEAPAAMSVTTDSAASVTKNSATLKGNVTSLGKYTAATAGFKYGACISSMSTIVRDENVTSIGEYYIDLDSLNPATTYYYSAFVATNTTDTVWGDTLSFSTYSATPCEGQPIVKDHENNEYATVAINGKCWMAQNLRVTTSPAGYTMYNGAVEPYAESYYAQNTACCTEGYLYNWRAAMDLNVNVSTITSEQSNHRGLCPQGWHIPTKGEWETVDNLSDFHPIAAGYFLNGNFNDGGVGANFWTATCDGSEMSYYKYVVMSSPNSLQGSQANKSYGMSVRCLRDPEAPATPMSATTDSANTVISAATLHGNVTSMGSYNQVYAGFKYGTSESALTSVVGQEAATTATGQFSYTIAGLTANTQYYFKAFAANGTDTVYGEVKNFTTLSINPCANAATVTDVDNNVYNTVQIGTQCWMAENLRTPTLTGNTYNPDNNANNVAAYGLLYDWAAVMQGATSTNYPVSGNKVQGICPTGWHVPSAAEYNTLTDYVNNEANGYRCGEDGTIAKALADTTGWTYNETACAVGLNQEDNNATGFSAVPAGFYNGSYPLFLKNGGFWLATESADDNANIFVISYVSPYAEMGQNLKTCGFSVRCVRDEEGAPAQTDTIAFLPNGGQGTMDTMFVTRGDTVLNTNAYTHDGTNFAFAGWNTEANGSGTAYANQAAVTTNGNLTLYAQWHTYCTGTPKTSVNEFGTSRIDSVKDIDNNKYTVVQIGNQCWMKENLRTSTNTEHTGNIYTPTTEEVPGYDVETYGRLYDWAAVMQGAPSSSTAPSGVQGICPTGWHVPSDAEWDTLTTYVKSQSEYLCEGCSNERDDDTYTYCIAKALAATTGWNSSSNFCAVGNTPEDNNKTGFSAVPAGECQNGYPVQFFGYIVDFWSATINDDDDFSAWCRVLDVGDNNVYRYDMGKELGYSVRCVRNNN